jgi:hypothetical protein
MGRLSWFSVLALAFSGCGEGAQTRADGGGGGGGETGAADGPAALDAAGDPGGPDAAAGTDAFGTDGWSGDGGAGEPVDASPDAMPPAVSPAFRAIYDTILAPRCGSTPDGGFSACHNPVEHPGQLSMPDAFTAYANLVNRPTVCYGYPNLTGKQIRVVPFEPAKSVIMLVNGDGACGVRHNLYLRDPLTDAQLATIEAWIRSGAP